MRLWMTNPYGEVNLRFGDVGTLAYWIKPEDLKAHRFENAWAEIMGH